MRSFASWIRVDIHWVWGLSNLSLGSLDRCLHYHLSLLIWFSLVVLICVGHHSLHFLASLFRFPSSLFMLVIPYLFLSYNDTHLWFITFSISIAYYIDNLAIYLFSYISSLTLLLFAIEFVGSRDYSAHHILYKRVLGLITRYLSLVSLHFFHPITLGLHYGPCHKTTLRPWDQTLSSTTFS